MKIIILFLLCISTELIISRKINSNFELSEKYSAISLDLSKLAGESFIFVDAGSSGSKLKVYQDLQESGKVQLSEKIPAAKEPGRLGTLFKSVNQLLEDHIDRKSKVTKGYKFALEDIYGVLSTQNPDPTQAYADALSEVAKTWNANPENSKVLAGFKNAKKLMILSTAGSRIHISNIFTTIGDATIGKKVLDVLITLTKEKIVKSKGFESWTSKDIKNIDIKVISGLYEGIFAFASFIAAPDFATKMAPLSQVLYLEVGGASVQFVGVYSKARFSQLKQKIQRVEGIVKVKDSAKTAFNLYALSILGTGQDMLRDIVIAEEYVKANPTKLAEVKVWVNKMNTIIELDKLKAGKSYCYNPNHNGDNKPLQTADTNRHTADAEGKVKKTGAERFAECKAELLSVLQGKNANFKFSFADKKTTLSSQIDLVKANLVKDKTLFAVNINGVKSDKQSAEELQKEAEKQCGPQKVDCGDSCLDYQLRPCFSYSLVLAYAESIGLSKTAKITIGKAEWTEGALKMQGQMGKKEGRITYDAANPEKTEQDEENLEDETSLSAQKKILRRKNH